MHNHDGNYTQIFIDMITETKLNFTEQQFDHDIAARPAVC